VAQVLALVGLAGFDGRSIHDLSGGEQQRVALARSLAPAPRLLLLDEPLGALDRALRERLMLDLRRILKEAGGAVGRPEGITAVYVTHDQAEAFAIADRVVVMDQGRIEQTGPPAALYRQPRTPVVARFLGMENIFSATAVSRQPPIVATALGELELAAPLPDRSHFPILIRPEAGEIGAAGANVVQAAVKEVSFRGRYQIATLLVGEETVKLEMETAVALPPPGEKISLSLNPAAIQPLESG
jgi:ABC-type Fe3+/spermidine/putrescine transport system ATPase subunit